MVQTRQPRSSRSIGVARSPPAHLKRYNTDYYSLYDHNAPQQVQPVVGPFTEFGAYDRYVLFIRPSLREIKEIPTSGVRIDDLTVSRVLGKLTQQALHDNWPAELDRKGMVRATRMPLGRAAKMRVRAGDIDIDGNVMGVEDEGYYYKWWRGLHCLMGDEGFAADMYLIRPSFERFRCRGFAFKKSYKAVVQAAEDH